MNQDNIFLKGEGDAWYNRNKDAIIKQLEDDDIPRLLSESKIIPTRILDVGCADGDRLEVMRNQFDCECYGIDPSLDAIEAGRCTYPKLSLSRSNIAEMKFPRQFFDLVTARFVFHWIDRNTLFESCEKIDACLKWGGYLAISDFFKEDFVKRRYHHTNDGMFTYKQFYPGIFIVTGNYEVITTLILPYDKTDNKFVTILKKKNQSVEE